MKDKIAQDLKDRAEQSFGEIRASELAEDIVKVAAELDAVRQYPIAIDDEP